MNKSTGKLRDYLIHKLIKPRPQDVVFEVDNKGDYQGYKINKVFKGNHLDYLSLEHDDAVDSFAGFVLLMKNNYNLGANQVTKFKIGDVLIDKSWGGTFGTVTNIISSNGRIYYEIYKEPGYRVEDQRFIESYYETMKTFTQEIQRFMNSSNSRFVIESEYTNHSFFHGSATCKIKCSHGALFLVENKVKVENVYKLLEEFVLGNN